MHSKKLSKKSKVAPKEPNCDDTDGKYNSFEHMQCIQDTFWRNDMKEPPCLHTGLEMVRNSGFNKGLAYTTRERQLLSIHGLLPVAVRSIKEQMEVCMEIFNSLTTPIERYLYMSDLERINRHLFYRLMLTSLDKFIKELDNSSASFQINNYSLLFINPNGLFITIKDRGHIFEVLSNWPHRNIRCLLVTDGAEVLGLGDCGAHGMALAITKRCQHTLFGGLHPDCCLPIMLDVGTDNEVLLNDPLYIGLRQHRVTGKEYDDFFDEFIVAVHRLYGPRAIIQCKDFGTNNAVALLERYRNRQCFINADIQCLAACGLAGIMGAKPLTHKTLEQHVLLFVGDNYFNIGMARLCMLYFKREGLDEAVANNLIWFCDEHGLVVKNRKNPVPNALQNFAKRHRPVEHLAEIIEIVKPTVLVGCSGQPNSFTADVLNAMEKSAESPIILAMTRPAEHAECSAEDAFVRTKGRCIFISGSQIPSVKYANKRYQPGCCSSVLMLSGIILGIVLSGMTTVPDEAFLVAAERISELVWPEDLEMRDVFPPLRKVMCINLQVAMAVFDYAYRRGLATFFPQPEKPRQFVVQSLYKNEYRDYVNEVYCMSDRFIGTEESRAHYK
ncbi:NADP-dependent malic enzyme-like [Scaptodrosophila lebanonensis]|uniref:NADP-dependent malic enzyme-like n=1 Tax=Drosophila lebanonensis TaxID=7225 RepID=A0A6J2TGQ4_DROLE|nr:NADP-dependent malic enzyme-like [Scaptodrosophila lebanonensis]